jgi:DNA polymerase sigma
MSNMAPPIRATKDELDPKTASNILGVTEQLLKEVETTKKDISIMQACLKELDALVKKLGPNWNVRPFGSAANGFCTRFSDLDVTCYQSPPKKELSANECIALLHPFLKEHGSFEVHEIISTARIPILKTRFDGKLDVDLSFQNTEPLPNTQLMRAYARLSPTIRQLGILVKLWANAEGVCGAQDGHLSSYSLTIMVLYCLQVDQYVKMPCFPTWEFTGHKRLPDCTNNVKWVCELPLASLLYRFFDFYASRHCWGYEVVSPRVGQRLYAGDATFQALQGRDSNMMIHIEDPFLSTRNLNCVLGQAQQRLLYEKLASAHADLQHGKVPVGFLMALQKCTRTNPKKELEAPTTKKDMKAAPIAQELMRILSPKAAFLRKTLEWLRSAVAATAPQVRARSLSQKTAEATTMQGSRNTSCRSRRLLKGAKSTVPPRLTNTLQKPTSLVVSISLTHLTDLMGHQPKRFR